MAPVRNLIFVLGDQLTPTLSSLANADPQRDLVLLAELHDEATYIRHNKKKIAFIAAKSGVGAMRAARLAGGVARQRPKALRRSLSAAGLSGGREHRRTEQR